MRTQCQTYTLWKATTALAVRYSLFRYDDVEFVVMFVGDEHVELNRCLVLPVHPLAHADEEQSDRDQLLGFQAASKKLG